MPETTSPIELDPTGADHHGEAARLREAGPVVQVLLPGGVPAWAITDRTLLLEVLSDPRVSKGWRNWSELTEGRVPDGWPLIGMIRVDNMVTADGDEHRRLRKPVLGALSPRSVSRLTPRITQIVNELLDDLPKHTAADGQVDVREHFAVEVPLQVICEIMGVPADWRRELRRLVDNILSAVLAPAEVLATHTAITQLLARLIALKTSEPGDDLTSQLIALRTANPEALSEVELADTLWVLLTAGQETTLSLITNATRLLLTHRDQLVLLQSKRASWENLVEEVLRTDGPIGNIPGRYALENITISDVTIPAGGMILAPYSALGRCPIHNGSAAGRFKLNSPHPTKHLAFGDGAHICPGAGLARTEARLALSALFSRYPDLRLAIDPEDLRPVKSIFTNSVQSLPVHL